MKKIILLSLLSILIVSCDYQKLTPLSNYANKNAVIHVGMKTTELRNGMEIYKLLLEVDDVNKRSFISIYVSGKDFYLFEIGDTIKYPEIKRDDIYTYEVCVGTKVDTLVATDVLTTKTKKKIEISLYLDKNLVYRNISGNPNDAFYVKRIISDENN